MEPWLSELEAGRPDNAWDLFAERYRRLILATIRRLVHEHDDVMDVFSGICQVLHADDLARLRRFVDRPAHSARFSTWLVVVVRNLTIDWLRERDGRRRAVVPGHLSPLQREIYTAVFLEGRSHVEAYELIVTHNAPTLLFSEFLREMRETYRLAPKASTELHQKAHAVVRAPNDLPTPMNDPAASAENAEASERISAVLGSLAPDVRLAVELFVVERMGAADVAQALAWPNAKAVYNRVYRALEALRAEFGRAGIRRDDL
jgi:RNA polymerase sigma factor (sigma-70 family)